jgi:RNA polymerase sigma factor (sigma-70 family)
MAELTEAERYLLDGIRRGSPDGWSQLVQRYEGRLLAFARSRLRRASEAEDLVQDTFVSFLTALKTFDEQYSIETFLFTILRRKLIDHFRGRASRVCFLQETLEANLGQDDDTPTPQIRADDLTASRYARHGESVSRERDALAGGLRDLVRRLRDAENFRDLKIVEMLFYAHVRNKDAARLLQMDEKQIALIKHRCLKEVRENVARRLGKVPSDAEAALDDAGASSMLSEIWEAERLTCPKRTTVGRLLLGTLDEPWKGYTDFHVNTLGCSFCRANLDDLKNETTQQPRVVHDRVMQSTIGFFRPA